MPIQTTLANASVGAFRGRDIISASASFNGSTSVLTRTFSTPTSRKVFTISFWFRRGATGASFHPIFHAGASGLGSNFGFVGFDSTDRITSEEFTASYQWQRKKSATITSTTTFYHYVLNYESSHGTGSSRARVYIDSTLETSFSGSTDPGSNADSNFLNTAIEHRIGRDTSTSFFSGLIADFQFIDGAAVGPEHFRIGNKPRGYAGSYGTNGFRLKFSDSSNLGRDFSGNGNHWTASNVTTSTTVP